MPSRYVRAVGAVVDRRPCPPPQILADQLTLSQLGKQIMPTILLLAPHPLRNFGLSFGPVCALQGFIVEGGRPPLTRACKNPFWQGKVKAMAFIGIFYLKAHNLIFSQNMKCSESGRYNKNYNLYSF